MMSPQSWEQMEVETSIQLTQFTIHLYFLHLFFIWQRCMQRADRKKDKLKIQLSWIWGELYFTKIEFSKTQNTGEFNFLQLNQSWIEFFDSGCSTRLYHDVCPHLSNGTEWHQHYLHYSLGFFISTFCFKRIIKVVHFSCWLKHRTARLY